MLIGHGSLFIFSFFHEIFFFFFFFLIIQLLQQGGREDLKLGSPYKGDKAMSVNYNALDFFGHGIVWPFHEFVNKVVA